MLVGIPVPEKSRLTCQLPDPPCPQDTRSPSASKSASPPPPALDTQSGRGHFTSPDPRGLRRPPHGAMFSTCFLFPNSRHRPGPTRAGASELVQESPPRDTASHRPACTRRDPGQGGDTRASAEDMAAFPLPLRLFQPEHPGHLTPAPQRSPGLYLLYESDSHKSGKARCGKRGVAVTCWALCDELN